MIKARLRQRRDCNVVINTSKIQTQVDMVNIVFVFHSYVGQLFSGMTTLINSQRYQIDSW